MSQLLEYQFYQQLSQISRWVRPLAQKKVKSRQVTAEALKSSLPHQKRRVWGFIHRAIGKAVLGACLVAFTDAAASAQLRIGLSAPLTGPSAAFGDQLKNGAAQAVADINAAGGILGRKLALSYGDDASEPRQGVSIANKFATEGIKFVVGPFNSGVTMAASEAYFENGILEITPSATNPEITDRGMWTIFRTCGRDDQQGVVAGSYIIRHYGGKRIAIVDDKSVYGKGIASEVQKTINANGIHEVLYEHINSGEKDFSVLVTKIKTTRADLVYWGGLYTEGALILRQMRDQGVQATLMGGDGIASQEFASIAGSAAEGTLMTYEPDPRKRPQAKAIVEEFRANNFEPESYTLYTYAAVQIFKQAAEATHSLEPKRIAERMHGGLEFSTVVGDISYNKKGDVTRPAYVMYVWERTSSGVIVSGEIHETQRH